MKLLLLSLLFFAFMVNVLAQQFSNPIVGKDVVFVTLGENEGSSEYVVLVSPPQIIEVKKIFGGLVWKGSYKIEK